MIKYKLRVVLLAAIFITLYSIGAIAQSGPPITNISGTICVGNLSQFRVTSSCTITQWTVSPGGTIQGASNQAVVQVIWSSPSTNAWVQVNYSNCSTSFLGLTVNAKTTPSVTISASPTTICQPQTIHLQATPTNVNGSPNYGWYIDSQLVATTSGTAYDYPASSLAPGGHNASVTISAMSCSTLNTVSSSSQGFTVSGNVGAVSTPSGTLSRCIGGGTDTYTASASNATSYTWSITSGAGTITSGGVVTWNSAFSGTAVVSVVANGCNGSTSSLMSTNVTVTPLTGAVTALSGTTVRCMGAGSDTYTPTVTNAGSFPSYNFTLTSGAGTISPLGGFVNWSSTFSGTATITVVAISCNGTNSAPYSTNVTVTPLVGSVSAPSGTLSRCIGAGTDTYTASASNATSYTWSITSGAGTITSGGVVTWNSTFSGTATVTVVANGCNGSTSSPSSTNVAVTPLVGSVVSTPSGTLSRCIGGGTDTYTASASNATSYTWSITSGAGTITSGGVVTWNSAFSGTATVTVVANGCSGSTSTPSSTNVTVTPLTGAVTALNGTTMRCIGAGSDTYTPTVTNASSSPSYNFTLSPAGAGTISPLGGFVNWSSTFSGTATITVVAISCNGTSSAPYSKNITVTPLVGSVSAPSGTLSRCIGAGTDTYTASASNATSYTWSITSGAGTITSGGVVTWNSTFSGTATVTVVANGCNGSTSSPSSTNVAVTPLVGSVVSTPSGTLSRCIGGGTDTYTASASNATSYTWSITSGAGTITSGGVVTWNSAFSGTATVTVVANGCNGSTSSLMSTNVTVTPLTGAVTALSGTTVRCIGAGSDTYTPTVTNASSSPSYNFTLSPAGAGNISPLGGFVNWSSTFSGTATITVVAISCNGTSSAPYSKNITVTPLVGSVSAPSGTLSRCIGAGTNTYTASASNATSYTWSITSGAGTITSGGVVTWNSTFSGTATVTVVANGCNGSTSSPSSTNVAVTPLVGSVVSTPSGTLSRCIGGGTDTYTASASNATSYTWSITSGAGTITSGGVVTWNSAFSGTATVTVVANGCNGSTSSLMSTNVTVTPLTGAVTALSGTTVRCIGAGSDTYTPTVTNASSSPSYNFTLSPAGAGNISPLGGFVNWSSTFSGTATVTVVATSCNGTTSAPYSKNVTVTPLVGQVSTPSGGGACRLMGSGTDTYTASASNASSYTWSITPAGAGTITSSGVVTWNSAFSGLATIGVSASGCNTTSASTDVFVLTSNITPAGNVLIPFNSSGVLLNANTGSGFTYQWLKDGQPIANAVGSSWLANLPGNYTVQISFGTCTSTSLATTTTLENNYNYIITRNIQSDKKGDGSPIILSDTPSLPAELKVENITYFDGLGRPMQSVATQGSPSRNDIVSPNVYDNFGREFRKGLPFVYQNNGMYKQGMIDAGGNYLGAALDFYTNTNNSTSAKIAHDTRYFSETVFEPSPLNRPSKDYGPGNDWGPTGGSDKYVYHQYLVNDASVENIIAWDVSTGTPVRSTASNSNINSGYYTTGQLNIKSTKDEQGNEVREYVDKLGHTILKKVQAVANPSLTDVNSYTQTYYIYDDMGLLRFVLQPELVKNLVINSANPTATDLNNFAFQYQYDARWRMVQKQVPGSGAVYMVYDQRDRLILTQDGNQRTAATKYWSFTKYDELNRPILTGIKDTAVALTQAQMQTVVDNYYALMTTTKQWRKYGEIFVGTAAANNIHGYSNKSYPQVTTAATLDASSYLTVTYYDNYSFRSDWPGTYTYLNENLSASVITGTYTQPATENTHVIGQATGSKTKVLDGGVRGGYTWLRSIIYHDDKYRVIQTQSDNYKGGKDVVSNLVDFVGKVLKSKETQTITTMTNQVAMKQVGNKNSKNITGNAWSTSGFSSMQQLGAGQDGWLEFTASETNTLRAIGLSQTDANTNYNSINYGFYLTASGSLQKCENTAALVTLGTYKSGDVLRIERTGTTIKYYQNNVLKNTSAVASTTALLVDAAFNTTNATLVNVHTSFTNNARTITHRLIYDHSQRLIESWHQLDTQPEYRTVFNEYNEIGQLVDKKLHSTTANATDNKQSVDYRYNIRGWLTSMNNSQLANDVNVTNDDINDYFGMNLLYQQSDANLGSTGLFNGNISGMKWSSNLAVGDIKETGYNFTYDPLNRLQNANARMNKTTIWQAGYYNESVSTYDLNGNIKNLTRTGDAGNQIDNLTYNYGTAGNQLQYVQDNTTDATNKAKGFADGHTGTTTDYTYDANGNMTHDLNKGIGANTTDAANLITYNFLNLPEILTKAGNTIQYIYTAGGQKLSQVVTNVNTIKQTDYVGAYSYENDALQFINHEEGRIVMSGTKMIYSNSFNAISSDITGINTTATTYALNGENYVKATSNNATAGNGLLPIGGTFTVQPGDRYRIRFKGYRNSHPAYLTVKAGATVLSSPGTALPNSAATESWIEQLVTIPAGATTMQVGVVWAAVSLNEFMLLNELEIDQLTTNAPEYQYHLKDHLGNIRITFTTTPTTKTYTAGFETADQTTEASNFSSYPSGAKLNTVPTNAHSGSNSYYLNGGYSGQVGLTKSLSVMPGDVVGIQAYAKYSTPSTTASNFTAFVASLLTAFNLTTPAQGEIGTPSAGVNAFGNWEIGAGGDESKNDAMKIFVTIIMYDRNYNFLDVAYQAVQGDGSMNATYTAKQPGYAYLYISNEHPYLTDVYFDDVTVTFTPIPVVQMEDFYPFGLSFNSYSRENTAPQNFLFGGKELQTDLGMNTVDFGWREYDPAIGRWNVIDQLSEHYETTSSYAFVQNNPISHQEIDGRWFDERNEKKAARMERRAEKRAGKLEAKANRREAHGKDVGDLRERAGELRQSGKDIKDMRGSKTEFRFAKAGDKSNTVRDTNGNGLPVTSRTGENQITMFMNGSKNFHEPRHGGQIARGEYTLDAAGNPSANFGAQEEISAYRAQYAYKGSLQYVPAIDLTNPMNLLQLGVGGTSTFKQNVTNINQINAPMLRTMVDQPGINQSYIYANYPATWWSN